MALINDFVINHKLIECIECVSSMLSFFNVAPTVNLQAARWGHLFAELAHTGGNDMGDCTV